jgi:pimeloyl-ACP methyl ester carboxylesterase
MKFVRVDGTALHVVRDGGTGPVVLFVQGLAGAWFDWDPVVPLLANDFRLIRFDRPGLGWSESEPPLGSGVAAVRQTAAGEAQRMASLLDALGFGLGEVDGEWHGYDAPERVILVAHSYGGFFAEAFARLYPERTAGVVFIDGSVESDVTPRGPASAPVRVLTRGAVTGLRYFGLNRLLGPVVRRAVVATLSTTRLEPDAAAARAVYASSRVSAATANELASYRSVAVELLELRCERAFPQVPVRVLIGMDYKDPLPWRERQRALVGLSPLGEVRELRDAKHLIAADRPDAVAEAVRDLNY